MTKRSAVLYLTVIGLILLGVLTWYGVSFLNRASAPAEFDGARALNDVKTQVAFGPRVPGTEGHAKIEAWIRSQLEEAGWSVDIQSTQMMGHPVDNIIAKRGDAPPEIILGAHYDSRIYADHDPNPDLRMQPMPGANDGASGVAVLLELARALPENIPSTWLVLFDAEDNGEIPGWDWLLGSRAFVAQNPIKPRAVVVIDMIGDADLNIYMEQNSTASLRNEIWQTADSLGYGKTFIPQVKYSMLDDHTPFLQAGLPAVDIIDFDYPYWHTTQDTPDKVSAESLKMVGETLLKWMTQQNRQ